VGSKEGKTTKFLDFGHGELRKYKSQVQNALLGVPGEK